MNERVEIRYVHGNFVAGTSALSPGVPRHVLILRDMPKKADLTAIETWNRRTCSSQRPANWSWPTLGWLGPSLCPVTPTPTRLLLFGKSSFNFLGLEMILCVFLSLYLYVQDTIEKVARGLKGLYVKVTSHHKLYGYWGQRIWILKIIYRKIRLEISKRRSPDPFGALFRWLSCNFHWHSVAQFSILLLLTEHLKIYSIYTIHIHPFFKYVY